MQYTGNIEQVRYSQGINLQHLFGVHGGEAAASTKDI
jgi:hypothetical protein